MDFFNSISPEKEPSSSNPSCGICPAKWGAHFHPALSAPIHEMANSKKEFLASMTKKKKKKGLSPHHLTSPIYTSLSTWS